MTENKPEESKDKDTGILGVKELSITPVITSFLKPTADMIGVELRDFVKEKIDKWKEKKRAENVAGHIQHAQEKLKQQDSNQGRTTETVKQLELFSDWVKGAQDVDPEDNILGKLWQNLLVGILEGNKIDKVIIDKMESISTQEALLLLNIYKEGYISSPSEKEKYFLLRLEDTGFIVTEKNELFIIFFVLNVSLILAATLGLFSLPLPIGEYLYRINNFLGGNLLLTFSLSSVIYIIFIYLFQKKKMYIWKLSWIGKELCDYAPDELKK